MYEDDFDMEEYNPQLPYHYMIEEIIDREIENRIGETVKALKENRIAVKEFREKYYATNRELNTLKQTFDVEIEKAVKKALDNYKREVFKYKYNDKIYIIKHSTTHEKCNRCDNGNIIVKIDNIDTQAKCPYCSNGRIYTHHYVPQEARIVEIEFHEWGKEKNKTIKFWVRYNDRYKDESKELNIDDIYATLEECQLACDEEANKK